MILLIYWILTTIYGVYWLVKHPSSRHGDDDDDEFTLLEVVAKIIPAAMIAWAIVPMLLLHQVKFKRR
jgi:heme/copper-type cytochrome/quinol oxidase subunit 2